MKRLRFEYETKLEFSCGVTEHSFTLRCMPFSDGRQVIAEPVCKIMPESGSLWRSRDSFGNMLICGRMTNPHDEFSFKVTGTAQIINSFEMLGYAPDFYSFHTPLTAADNNIMSFYQENRPISDDILEHAKHYSSCVYDYMSYKKGVTQIGTSAAQAFSLGEGVCQDYAHVLLSLLRLGGIRCRYVAGLAFECGETHAWVEVYDGKRWVGIDPTHNRLIGDNYIKICHGRDYSDCPIERGIYIGSADSVQTVLSMVTEE